MSGRKEPLPEWADDAFLHIFDNMHWPTEAAALKHPKAVFIQRALEGYWTAYKICTDTCPLPNALVPLWMPPDSYLLMQRKMEAKWNDAGLIHLFTKILTYDFDRAKQILTFHNLTKPIIVATRALVRALHAQTHPFCLGDGTGRTWRLFSGDQHPRFPNGSDTRLLDGNKFAGWTQVRMPTFALFYRGPRQNEVYPDVVFEIAAREKARALEERARWYMRTSRGETRVVVGMAMDEDAWSLTLWRRGEEGEEGGDDARYHVEDVNGHAGVAIPIRELIPPEAVEAIEESDCRATVAMLDRRIEITWVEILKGFEAWVALADEADKMKEAQEAREKYVKDTNQMRINNVMLRYAEDCGIAEALSSDSDSDTDTDTESDSD